MNQDANESKNYSKNMIAEQQIKSTDTGKSIKEGKR